MESFQDETHELLPPDVSLTIRLEALNPKVNAETLKQGNQLTIEVLGGMLRHREMNQNVMLLLLCHEIGHFLGGPPLKSRNGWSSVEGQADYYSTAICIKNFNLGQTEFYDAVLGLTKIYAGASREGMSSLEGSDPTIVERINYGYPSVQCRLDTLLAGWMGQARPRCWFKE